MKKVKYYEYEYNKHTGKTEKHPVGYAKFHQFGIDYEEFEDGAVNYTTAVIELDNGKVKNINVELIEFLK